MSGIGFVIPNADFSDSPLGAVTIELTNAQRAARIAEDFAEVIGTSDYNTAITAMVKDLLDSNLWEKTHALWPILGNTLDTKKANLKDITVPMQLMANASAGYNKITFVDTISVGTPVVETNFTSEFSNARQRSIIFRATSSDKATKLHSTVGVQRITEYGSRGFMTGMQNSFRIGIGSLSCKISYTQDGNKSVIYKDGEYIRTQTGTWNPTILGVNTLFGGTGEATSGEEGSTIAASEKLFNGDLYYFVLGHYTDKEIVVVDSILADFETAVGKVLV